MTLKDNLLVCLEMNEGSGTSAVNSSGIGPNGTLLPAPPNEPAWVPGTFAGTLGGAAVEFDSTKNQKIEIPDHPSLSPTAITVALWIWPDAWSTNFTSVASKSQTSSPFSSWDFRKPSGASTIQAFIDCGASGTATADSLTNISTTGWQHVAFTFDRTKLIVYRNGVAGSTTTVSTNDLGSSSVPLWIGGNPGNPLSPASRYFDGKVDQFAMWGRALSEGEIKEIYNLGAGLPLAQWDNVSSTLLALDAEYHIGLVADSSAAAADNTATLNDALAEMWPGGSFQFAHGGKGPILVPIHFAGKQFWFDGTIRTSTRSGGMLIGTGRQNPKGNGEYGPSGLGGQQTQFIQSNPDPDPDSVFVLVRNEGFQFKNIFLYGRHLSGNIGSGTGDRHGVGIALEGREQPPVGGHIFENFAVVDCEVGIKFLEGYYDSEGDLVPDENHADTSLFESGFLVNCPIGIQSLSQQASGHTFRRMSIGCPEDGVVLDVQRGGLWSFHELFAGYNDVTLLKVEDFSPNQSRFDIHFWRDGYASATQRLTLFEYAGGAPASAWDWDCRFSGQFATETNAVAATDIVRFNGLEAYPQAISKIWFDFNNMDVITPPTGLAWEVSGSGPWRRLVPTELTTNLVEYWPMDESSGNALGAADSKTLTNNNTVGSTTGLVYPTARNFVPASNQNFTRTADSDLRMAGNTTIMVWVKFTSQPSGIASIFAKDDFNFGGDREYILYWNKDANGTGIDRFVMETYSSSGAGGQGQVKANNFGAASTSVWYMLLAEYNAIAGTQTLSVNNGTPNSASRGGGVFAGNCSLRVGGFGSFWQWNGQIGPAAIWSRLLTNAEKAALYNSGSGLQYVNF